MPPTHALATEETAQAQPDVERLYRLYRLRILRWATRLAGSSGDAEDIVQDVFLLVHRQSDSLWEVRHPAPWLLRVTFNVARHHWRGRQRAGRPAVHDDPACSPPLPPTPLDDLERQRAAAALEAAIGSLDPQTREIYWLSDVQQLPAAEVAARTGVQPDTLRVRRFRARERIARRLEAEGRPRPGAAAAPAEATARARRPCAPRS